MCVQGGLEDLAHFSLIVMLPAEVFEAAQRSASPERSLAESIQDALSPHVDVELDDAVEETCHCMTSARARAREAADVAAQAHLGSWNALISGFERRFPCPEPSAVPIPTGEVRAYWEEYACWVDALRECCSGHQAFIDERFAAREYGPRTDCWECGGTGRSSTRWASGRLDYHVWGGARSELPSKLRAICGVPEESRFDGLSGRLRPEAKRRLTSPRELAYLLRRVPASVPDILDEQGRWHAGRPTPWGIHHLPPQLEGLTFYAEDERWPLCAFEVLERAEGSDGVAVVVDCHC